MKPPLILFFPGRGAEFFEGAVPLLGIEHFVFGAFGTFAFLPPDLGDPLGLFALTAQDPRLEFIDEHPARPVPVHGLRPFLLAFDDKTRGFVLEDYACRNLIDVLASRPAGTHERLF